MESVLAPRPPLIPPFCLGRRACVGGFGKCAAVAWRGWDPVPGIKRVALGIRIGRDWGRRQSQRHAPGMEAYPAA
jgi:hypothetical protein